MGKLIALVAVAVMASGERQTIAPGDEVPELSDHDRKELLASGCVVDIDQQDKAEQARRKQEAKDGAAFKESRRAVLAQQESTQVAEVPEGPKGSKAGSK